MKLRKVLAMLAVTAALAGTAVAGVLTYDTWREWLPVAKPPPLPKPRPATATITTTATRGRNGSN